MYLEPEFNRTPSISQSPLPIIPSSLSALPLPLLPPGVQVQGCSPASSCPSRNPALLIYHSGALLGSSSEEAKPLQSLQDIRRLTETARHGKFSSFKVISLQKILFNLYLFFKETTSYIMWSHTELFLVLRTSQPFSAAASEGQGGSQSEQHGHTLSGVIKKDTDTEYSVEPT